MVFPWLSELCSRDNENRSRNRALAWLCSSALLWLIASAQAFAGTANNPQISLTQNINDVAVIGDSSFSVQVTVIARNTGEEALVNLQLEDALSFFATTEIIDVKQPRVVKGNLTVNPGYDGAADTRLLAGTDTLAVGAEAALRFEFRLRPRQNPGPFGNTAIASATGKTSGRDAHDTAKAYIHLPIVPAAEFVKTVGDVTANGDGTYSTTITLDATNTGSEDLERVRFKDELDIFGAGHLVSVSNIEVLDGDLTLNPGYDGLNDIVLTDGHIITQGERARIRFTVTFDPGPEAGPFHNVGILWAAGVQTGLIRDYWAHAMIHLPPPAPVEPEADFVKTVTDVVANGDGTYSAAITLDATNVGSEDLVHVTFEDDLDIFGAGQLLGVGTFEVLDGDLTLNPDFDGLSDIRLTTGEDMVPQGQRARLRFSITFDPGPETGPFENCGTLRVTGDESALGRVFEDCADIRSPANPLINLQKLAGPVTDGGDGTLSVPITLIVTNTGDEVLTALQIEDGLDIFGQGQLIAIEDLASETLTLNPGYDGLTNNNLLAGTDELPLAAESTVTFTMRFDPGSEPGPFLNTATAQGTGQDSGERVSDSDDASFPAGPAEPPPSPAIEVQKLAGDVVDNGDDTLSVPISITITNTGNEALLALRVEDNLDIFGEGQLIAIEDLDSDAFTLNPGFDGLNDLDLLAGTDVLPLAESGTITFVLRFDPGPESGPFVNTAMAYGSGEITGEVVTDSDDATFPAMPAQPFPDIIVDKTAGQVVDTGDNTLSVPITITVTNNGNELLTALQIEDDLDIFGAGQLIAVENLDSELLTVNPGYDGLTDTELLDGADELPLASLATVTFTLRFDPGTEPGPFINAATASATSYPSNVPVSDSDEASFDRLEPVIPVGPTGIVVAKRADRQFVQRGESIAYEVSVTNITVNPVAAVVITDIPPPGFRFVENSAFLVRAGADRALYTPDDIVSPLGASGIRPVVFDAFDLEPEERVLVRYLMRVSVGVADGEYINRIAVTPDPQRPSAKASASVMVFGDPVFEQTTLIGKVFDDRNENGRQDEDERGLPGVRLATVEGLTIETDAQGRYHLADVSVGRFNRGANFIIKLDEASLPWDTEVISQNPRVIRLTQAMLSKVNFAVKLPSDDGPDEGETEPDEPACLGPYDYDNAVATKITVSGGLFGCGQLAARTLYGRLACARSDVTVFAEEKDANPKDSGICYESPVDGEPIVAGQYPIELESVAGTRLRITGAGDVIRMQDPNNNEHIIVTPFRDDTDNSVVSALRIINDGIDPEWVRARATEVPGEATKPRKPDQLHNDPRLDVLALTRAVLDDDGKLLNPIKFAIYSNYSEFIEGYRLEVYGRSEAGFERTLLFADDFTEYRFDTRREFASGGADLRKYAELEYLLKASNCPFPLKKQGCVVDVTSPRILNLRDDASDPDEHLANEIWGQSSLADQRIPVRGGRIRISGKTDPDRDFVALQGSRVPAPLRGSLVPVGREGTYVAEEYVELERTGPGKLSASTNSIDEAIPAYASEIRVSGGLFGCGKIAVEKLEGRNKNGGTPIQAVTVVAEPRGTQATEDCAPGDTPQGQVIEVTTKEGSRFQVTEAGDVLPMAHPAPRENRQQLVITPFRDYTDSTKVSALRISNEGSPIDVPETPREAEAVDELPEDHWFAVALASLTIGDNDLSGEESLLANDDHFDGSTYTDGRLAFYAKGRVKEKYVITAQLDTTEDELRNLNDNLKRKDPRRIFRQLDPNRYFPTYGDDSVTTTDVDTQGAFYARADWDKSTAMWGNFNTGFTDTEFMQYNRSLYGARFEHESLETTKFGNAKTVVAAFGSEAQSAAAHVTFKATGGSLYYLRDTDIVQGSEKAWVEVRRRDTQQVVETTVLIQGRDYEIDAIQGRLILRRPLSQVVNSRERPIIRSSSLEGDDVYLLVDYEFVPEMFEADDLTYGGRGRTWFGDHVALGATAVADERDGTDYTMQGVDLTLQRSEGSYVRAEFAQSEARQNNANFVSDDGGLSFRSQTSGGTGNSLDGDAFAIEARADLSEWSETISGDVRTWWKTRDAEFSTGRLGQGVDVDDRGIEMVANLGDNLGISASHTDFEREQQSRKRVTRAQVDGRLGDWELGAEIRHEDLEVQALPSNSQALLSGPTNDGEALLIGARVGYAVTGKTSVYAAGQTVADDEGKYEENDRFTVGINTQRSDDLGISFEASDGDHGAALVAGMDYAANDGLNFNLSGGVGSGAISQFATRYAIGEGHELYGSYAIDPDRTDTSRNLLTLGQRRAFGNGIGLFTESQFGKDDRYASVGHIFGLDFEGDDDWRFSATMQVSENEGLGLAFDRRALSFGAYRNAGDFKFSSQVEYREDEGSDVHTRQYLTSNSFSRKLDDSRRWLGQLNVSWTDDELNGGRDARFVELEIGHAYRPAANDKLNLIARYSFLYDLPTEGQATIRPDERSHLISVEGIYDPQNRWELAVKLAARSGEKRAVRDMGPWEDFGLRLAAVRARYEVNDKWDGLVEYRWLSDIDGDSERHGALVTLYRQIKENLKVGVGFNFTDFNDDLRLESYDNRGWFVDIVGMY